MTSALEPKSTPIRVLHVNNTDVIGGRFNGFALNSQLPEVGIYSELAVWQKDSSDDRTWRITTRPRWFKLNVFIQRVERRLSIQSLLYPGSWLLLFSRRFFAADVLHFHLLHNHFFSLFSMPFLTWLKPTVWTVHDTWGFTGRCVQPLGCEGWRTNCGVCPDPHNHMWTRVDRSRFAFRVKRFIYAVSRFEVHVASAHMKQMVEQSPLLKTKKIRMIPFGIDTKKFEPGSKAKARLRFGIAEDAFVMSFRINGGHYKGAEYILALLRTLKTDRPICIIAIELPSMVEEFKSKYHVIGLDWIDDERLLVDVYQASDLFLMPSLAEAFGVMAIEAMACGLTPIVFEGTALPGVVDSPNAGIAVPKKDVEALVAVVENFILNPQLLSDHSRRCRKLAEERYSVERYLLALRDVYGNLAEGRGF